MKKLTAVQGRLYEKLLVYMTTKSPMKSDHLKNLTEFKTFSSSFNALLSKGWVKRYKEGDGNNTYILTKKK